MADEEEKAVEADSETDAEATSVSDISEDQASDSVEELNMEES